MANSLAQDRIDQLNGIDFKWAMKEAVPTVPTVPWETRFNELVQQYKTKHGDINVPRSQGKLGNWVSRQRVAYNANSLAQNRIDRLSSIGFVWAMNATKGGTGPKVPLSVPSNNSSHNNGSVSDDDVDEVGALIYEQVMRQRCGC